MQVPTTVKNRELVEKRRQQLVLAAVKLFSTKGFHKTTLRELAEESGLSHGNIYDYVGNKEDIFYLIYNFLAGQAMEILDRSVENIHNPIDKLRRMIRGEFNVMDQWPDALLLMYQESHILRKPYLRELLSSEREHLRRFELVIEECISQGLVRDCNVRLISNLIKSMVDSWVIKRWDLRGHADQLEAERSILNLVFHGLLMNSSVSEKPEEIDTLRGKSALVVNGGTVLGKAICSFLLLKGVRLASYVDVFKRSREYPVIPAAQSEAMTLYSAQENGPMTSDLFNRIEKDFGPIDIYVHDLGTGSTDVSFACPKEIEAGRRLEANLRCAQDIADVLQEGKSRTTLGRILYLAPWAWDRYLHPLRYRTVLAGTVGLTEAMAKAMADSMINVNCIIPGFIKTVRPSRIQKEKSRAVAQEVPVGRLGEISDVTNVVLFLLGDTSRYMTGQILSVTGGMHSHN